MELGLGAVAGEGLILQLPLGRGATRRALLPFCSFPLENYMLLCTLFSFLLLK